MKINGAFVRPQVLRHDERGLPAMQTQRLVLRIACPRDLHALVAFRRENKEHLAPWEPARDDRYYQEEAWRVRIIENQNSAERDQAYGFVLCPLEEPARVIGVVNLRDVYRYFLQSAELGYAIDYRFEGQGLMTEALQAVMWFATVELGLHRIQACYMPANLASARVLEKLGFVIEGRLRQSLMVNGVWEDHILTSYIADPDPQRSISHGY